MHRMVARERQSRNNRRRGIFRRDGVGGQRVADDAIVDLRIDRILVQTNPGTAFAATLDGLTEALGHVRFPRSRLVLQSYEESARVSRGVAVVRAGPSVQIERSI